MPDKVRGTFVSQKINKVRWKPEDLSYSSYFVTGSWDDQVNTLMLWSNPRPDDDPDQLTVKTASLNFSGDVTELLFIDDKRFIASSSHGFAKLFEIEFLDLGKALFKELIVWDKLHEFSYGNCCPCTGLACFEEDIATIGEDGRIALLTARQKNPLRKIDKADSCSLHCVCFLKYNEVLTGNIRGHMKVWDLKSQSNKPATTFMMSGDQIAASCVTFHPTQRHMLLVGGDDGSLTVWDMRHNTFPVTVLSAHAESVSELKFHPDRPEHLFSCSADGDVWHWNTSTMSRGTRFSSSSDMSIDENPWLSSDAAKHRIEVLSTMPKLHKPVNSLDVNHSRLICSSDNEAVYVINDVIP
ncbi:Coatomer subunit beta' [Gryllus bimaculatus]|nr:Coatomer subunit beta' [Gryllus bimaculatus]